MTQRRHTSAWRKALAMATGSNDNRCSSNQTRSGRCRGDNIDCTISTQPSTTSKENEILSTLSDSSDSVNTTYLNTTSSLQSSTEDPSDFNSSSMLIVLPIVIAVSLFLLIVFVCFMICRKKNKSLQKETYNQYSHVDQTDFVDPPADPVRIPQAEIEYEFVEIPVYELEISVPKSSKESGFSETETCSSYLMEKQIYPSPNTLINGPQFSGPKDVSPNPSLNHHENSQSPTQSPKMSVSPANVGADENYFTLTPATPGGFVINEPGLDSGEGRSDYFTLEKIDT